MKDILLTQILLPFLCFLFFVCPLPLQSTEMNSSLQELKPGEIVEWPKQMTQKEMNELFGEDPYLGQTSYLQSPDGFSQRED